MAHHDRKQSESTTRRIVQAVKGHLWRGVKVLGLYSLWRSRGVTIPRGELVREPITETAMPKNVIDDVTSSLRQLYRRPFTFFVNRPQKWSFWGMVTAFGGLGVFALLFSQVPWPQPRWVWWARLALLCALITYGSVAVNHVASTVGTLRLVLPPRRILEPVIAAFTAELALIARLEQTYEPRALAYALDRLSLEAAQLRTRIALLIGALDKVGLIPLVIGAYFPLRALFKEQPPTSSELSWIIGTVAGLGGFYLMAFGFLHWTQRLDEACMVLKHAGQAKPSAPPLGNGHQGVQDQGSPAIVARNGGESIEAPAVRRGYFPG
jgi:hypothetical protein